MDLSMFDLSGKVAAITGGATGIGFGIAKGLAHAGATIAVADLNAEKGKAATTELGANARFFPVDVSRQAECRGLIDAIVTAFGKVDILVNSAGIAIRKRPEDYTDAEWHQIMDVNATGTFACCQAVYSHMKKGGGKIINIASVYSVMAGPMSAPYCASKGAVIQMTKAMAVAWAKDNVQVNAIVPGWIDTDLTVAMRQVVPGLSERVMPRVPAGRWGKPEDFAGVAIFLASRASDFVTGEGIVVDGGFLVSG
ncbi:MAG: glucose 1-dehydrogenase [Dongiaceae bacterium]